MTEKREWIKGGGKSSREGIRKINQNKNELKETKAPLDIRMCKQR